MCVTYVGISTRITNIFYALSETFYTQFQFLRRKHNACTVGTPEKPKTYRIYVGISSNILPPTRQIWLQEPSRRRPAVEVEAVQGAPLGPISTQKNLAIGVIVMSHNTEVNVNNKRL